MVRNKDVDTVGAQNVYTPLNVETIRLKIFLEFNHVCEIYKLLFGNVSNSNL